MIAPADIEAPSYDRGGYRIEKTLPKDFTLKKDKSRCNRTRCICLSGFAVLLVASITGMSIALTGDPNPANYFLPVDPPGATESIRWDATAGLYLTVENACDESWTPLFDQSILEWNTTEALILRTRKVAYDSECSPSQGRLKVCNGDYGETDWKGLNTAIMNAATGLVIYSTSLLNDFHLKTDDDRVYTMCHENGHGFGLPHTDEDHFNRDRGDCMDYTTRTRNNLLPGDFNLDLLESLYGTPAQPLGSDPLTDSGVSAPTTPSPPPRRPPPNPDKEKEENEDDRRRFLDETMADSELDYDFDTDMAAAREDCKAEHCVYQIDEDFYIVINKMLA